MIVLASSNARSCLSSQGRSTAILMLGYFAEYGSGEIQVEPEEIIEANWFRFDQLPEVPPAPTISGRLIEEFVRQRKSQH